MSAATERDRDRFRADAATYREVARLQAAANAHLFAANGEMQKAYMLQSQAIGELLGPRLVEDIGTA